MSYPNLTGFNVPVETTLGTNLPAVATENQTFSIGAAELFESDANGDATTVPLGQSGPFALQIDDELIICSSFDNGVCLVFEDEGTNGRGYGESTIASHNAGSSLVIVGASSVQSVATGGGGAGVNLQGVGDPIEGNPTTPTFVGQTYQDIAEGTAGTGTWTAGTLDGSGWVQGALGTGGDIGVSLLYPDGPGGPVGMAVSSPGDEARVELLNAGVVGPLSAIAETVSGGVARRFINDGNPNGEVQAVDLGDELEDTDTPAKWIATSFGSPAQVVADVGPSFPLTITEGVNDEFNITGFDPLTIPAGVYANFSDLEVALGTLTHPTLSWSDNGTVLNATTQWAGAAQNSWTITEGNGGAAAIGFTGNPDNFSGGVDTLWEQVGPNILQLSYNGVGPFPVKVMQIPDGWPLENSSLMAQLTTGPGLITGLKDANGDDVPDGWTFAAAIFVEGGAVIVDIIAVNGYQAGNGIGGVQWWGSNGDIPQLSINPDGIVMPDIPTSDPAIAGAFWSNLGIVTVSAG